MRTNLPVTGGAIELDDADILVSATDTRGVIRMVNRDFVRISGFSEDELLGQPHNLVRHPDMPPQVFADLWRTLQAGRPWEGIIKNRAKDGDHYWVRANVAPVHEDGQLTGYMSVRRRVGARDIARAERAYAAFRSGRSDGLRLQVGRVGRRDRLKELNPLWRLSLRQRLVLAALGTTAAGAGLAWLAGTGAGAQATWLAVAALGAFSLYCAWWLSRDVVDRLEGAVGHFRRIASGHYDDHIPIDRNDEIGRVMQGLKSMQVRLGFEVIESRRRARSTARIQRALDVAPASVLVANHELRVVHANQAARDLLARIAGDVRDTVAGFDPDHLAGVDLAALLAGTGMDRAALQALEGTRAHRLRLGSRNLDLTVTPVLEDGAQIGVVTELRDRTEALAMQDEVAEVLRAAAAGDFSRRIRVDDKHGFLRVIAGNIDQLLQATSHSLEAMQQVLSAIAGGDLTRRIDSDMQGVFGRMKDSTNQTVDQLSAIVSGIQGGARGIDAAAARIASGNADLSRRTEEQAAALQETAASLESLTATVRQTAGNALQASELARGTAQAARHGGELTARVVDTMGDIDAASRRIEDIIGVIDGIAFQTNILALNAAVEAARAGEQGRGFAVVASEVRSLAQRSAGAAREIKDLVETSVHTVGNGTRLVGEAGGAINEIVAGVQQVAGLIAEISSAAQEQSTGIGQVNQAISQMDEGTQHNAELVEHARRAANELERQSGQLVDSVAAFRLAGKTPQTAATPAAPRERTRATVHG